MHNSFMFAGRHNVFFGCFVRKVFCAMEKLETNLGNGHPLPLFLHDFVKTKNTNNKAKADDTGKTNESI